MSNVVVRLAMPGDLPDLRSAMVELQEHERRLAATRLPGEQIADPYLARLQREAAEKRGAILVVESDGVFAGFAAGGIIERDHIPEIEDSNRFGYFSDICIPRAVRFFETQPATQFARLRRRSVVRFWLWRSATGNSADRSRDFPRMSGPRRSSTPTSFEATRPDRLASFSISVSSMPWNMAGRAPI
jgi:hypothetical protein